MARLTIDALEKIRDRRKGEATGGIEVMLCGGEGCSTRGGGVKLRDLFTEHLKKHGLDGRVAISITGCNGFCGQGPIIKIQPEGIFYQGVKADDIAAIVEQHLAGGKPVEKLMYKDFRINRPVAKLADIPYFSLQTPRVLKDKGLAWPEDIDHYIERGGYGALVKSLNIKPEDILKEIKESGLRGRGGAGFSTGLKWDICRTEEAPEKYVICNAGPISRSIIEIDPHLIIEGMVIAGRAIGAAKGYVYVREPGHMFLIKRVEKALEQAYEYGLLGKNILDGGFGFDLELYIGAGTFICGEETALISSMEGSRGYPTPKPPYPARRGLMGMPTIVNNAETYANVPMIILDGATAFKTVGTKNSRGTKVLTISGAIRNGGLIEIPMGMSLRTILYDMGGWIRQGGRFKAVQVGGTTGGYIPENLIDTPFTYEDMTKIGAIVGSGNLVVVDDSSCMVNNVRFALEFAVAESCGKCVPCRIGSKVLLNRFMEIIEGPIDAGGRIPIDGGAATASSGGAATASSSGAATASSSGAATASSSGAAVAASGGAALMPVVSSPFDAGGRTPVDLDVIADFATEVAKTSMCGFGQTFPNPVLTSLKYFRDEYEEHIKQKWCRAGRCKNLCTFYIDKETCTGCGSCARKCPQKAIGGEKKKPHTVDQSLCVKCRSCFETCAFDSVKIGPRDMFKTREDKA
jgi:NADH:ubiquinone oxidoreductase subunit F (NADH-binding)/(2Fe-2S) ferredoxin